MSRLGKLELLLKTRPLVCDGAMGTQLQQLGLAPGACGVAWNIEAPDRVRTVHQRYLDAGADLLTTNTFSGTSLALAGHGLGARAAELNRAAAALAREVAGDRAFVLGDMGPFGGLLEPYGDAEPEAVKQAFAEQAAALLEGGADVLLVETMSDPAEAVLGIEAAREAGAALVMTSFAFQQSGDTFRTMMGTTVADAVRAAVQAGAGIVGANCGTELALETYIRLAEELVAAAGDVPVVVQPNAGSPEVVDGEIVYRTTPEAFGAAAVRFVEAGAR
ncbi:MAG: homocysteine methyltransferase, partial [Verrucomicrobia bacterium]